MTCSADRAHAVQGEPMHLTGRAAGSMAFFYGGGLHRFMRKAVMFRGGRRQVDTPELTT